MVAACARFTVSVALAYLLVTSATPMAAAIYTLGIVLALQELLVPWFRRG